MKIFRYFICSLAFVLGFSTFSYSQSGTLVTTVDGTRKDYVKKNGEHRIKCKGRNGDCVIIVSRPANQLEAYLPSEGISFYISGYTQNSLVEDGETVNEVVLYELQPIAFTTNASDNVVLTVLNEEDGKVIQMISLH